MSATVHVLGRISADRSQLPRGPRTAPSPPTAPEQAWLVDVGALARCRALFAGHEAALHVPARLGQQALLEVPPAYAQFCRTHFGSVKRLHPELCWEDACAAYAVALAAHAALCDEIDPERERQLADNWNLIRGNSELDWSQARGLVADGCSALARLDPLAMRR